MVAGRRLSRHGRLTRHTVHGGCRGIHPTLTPVLQADLGQLAIGGAGPRVRHQVPRGRKSHNRIPVGGWMSQGSLPLRLLHQVAAVAAGMFSDGQPGKRWVHRGRASQGAAIHSPWMLISTTKCPPWTPRWTSIATKIQATTRWCVKLFAAVTVASRMRGRPFGVVLTDGRLHLQLQRA